MSRIKNYQIDTAITGGDKLVGSDIGDNNSTKLYSIGGIAEFYSKTGDADGAKIGLQYQKQVSLRALLQQLIQKDV